MATIKQLKDHDTNENIYPLTHIGAVRDNNNNTVLELLNEKQDKLTFDTTPTANSTNPVTSGGIKIAIDNAAELYVISTEGTSTLFYAAVGYISNLSRLNTVCEGILTALKNNKKLYFEIDNREDGGAKETYSAVYADYVEPANESTVINFIVNHSLLDFYKVTLTKALGATNWVVTYVDKVTQEQLISGTSIKTINNTSLLGSGDISVQAPLTFDLTPTANSNNPVVSKGIKSALDTKVNKVTSTDNAIVRFDGTTGDVQNSSAKVTDDGDISVRNVIVHGSVNTNDTRIISSDNAGNIYASINGTIPLVITGGESPAVRPSVSNKGIANLGDTSSHWNNVRANKFITNGGTNDQVVLGTGTLQNLNGLYASNISIGTSANYIKEPEFKTVKINGSSTNAASTNNCVLQYDITNKCLNFVFN